MLIRDNDPEVFAHVEPIFHDAAFIHHLGIRLEAAGRGWCRTSIAVGPDHLQQHGFVHAGVITTLADHTAGGSARAAVSPGTDVITIEFKINFLKPAKADTLAATGQVLRAGKTIIASESEVYAMAADGPVLVAKCISTLAVIPQRERIRHQADIRVAIVFSSDATESLPRLASAGHVWIVRSPANERAAEEYWRNPDHPFTVTLFNDADSTASARDRLRIVDVVEGHRFDYSETHEYPILEVVGIPLDPSAADYLRALGFDSFEERPNAFVAYRPAKPLWRSAED